MGQHQRKPSRKPGSAFPPANSKALPASLGTIHSHPTVTRCHSLSPLEQYQRRPGRKSGLSPLICGNKATATGHSVSGYHVGNQNFHTLPVVTNSCPKLASVEAKMGNLDFYLPPPTAPFIPSLPVGVSLKLKQKIQTLILQYEISRFWWKIIYHTKSQECVKLNKIENRCENEHVRDLTIRQQWFITATIKML